jgi:hypothetical protein
VAVDPFVREYGHRRALDVRRRTAPSPRPTEAFPRPEVAYVAVRDIPPSQIVIAWADSRSSVLADDFVETAVATLS